MSDGNERILGTLILAHVFYPSGAFCQAKDAGFPRFKVQEERGACMVAIVRRVPADGDRASARPYFRELTRRPHQLCSAPMNLFLRGGFSSESGLEKERGRDRRLGVPLD